MAHFAELDDNNIVVNLHKVENAALGDLPYPESEPVGIEFLRDLFGPDKIFKQYSYNMRAGVHYNEDGTTPSGQTGFRKNVASVGGKYDATRDAFVLARPYPSWTFDETKCTWEPPVSQPPCEGEGADRICYGWDENQQKWIKISLGDLSFVSAVGDVFPTFPSGSMSIDIL